MTKKLCEEWINLQLSPKFQAAVVKQQGVSPVINNVGDLVTPEEKAFGEMWEEAKKQR